MTDRVPLASVTVSVKTTDRAASSWNFGPLATVQLAGLISEALGTSLSVGGYTALASCSNPFSAACFRAFGPGCPQLLARACLPEANLARQKSESESIPFTVDSESTKQLLRSSPRSSRCCSSESEAPSPLVLFRSSHRAIAADYCCRCSTEQSIRCYSTGMSDRRSSESSNSPHSAKLHPSDRSMPSVKAIGVTKRRQKPFSG